MILIPIYFIFGIALLMISWFDNKEDTLYESYLKRSKDLTIAGNIIYWLFFLLPLLLAYTFYYAVYFFLKLTVRR